MKKLCAAAALCLAALGLGPAPLAFSQEKMPFVGPVYEIFPGSFADSDADGLGDLMGVAEKADYIASLGVRAVWLTPFYPAQSYHGYDVVDYCAAKAQMGGLEAFDALVSALHARGISVLCDLVLNHTGSEHPWFLEACRALSSGEESPYTDYYVFSKTKEPKMHDVPGAPGWYYLGEFTYTMPDLNLDSAAVREEIERIVRFWLERGVDGFRLDAITYYYGGDTVRNTEFLTWLMETIRGVRKDAYVVGEAWTDDATISRLYESGIDSLFHFSLADTGGEIIGAVRNQNGARLARLIAGTDFAGTDAVFLTNHDMARSAGMLTSNPQKMRAAAAAYLLSPGIPFIYYGEEIGMTGSGRDENKRLPMVWGEAAYTCNPPEMADQKQKLQKGVVDQEEDPDSVLNMYRRLLTIRNAHPEIPSGRPVALDLGVKAIFALDYGRSIAIINMGKTSVTVAIGMEGTLDCEGGAALENGRLTLEPWAAAVITKAD
ncbi:MAG: alpha-amylase [Clostridia bacterium]|nr:alpha-amylase [Clostridia bacterium]